MIHATDTEVLRKYCEQLRIMLDAEQPDEDPELRDMIHHLAPVIVKAVGLGSRSLTDSLATTLVGTAMCMLGMPRGVEQKDCLSTATHAINMIIGEALRDAWKSKARKSGGPEA